MLLKQKAKAEDEKLASQGFCPRDSSSDSSRVLSTSFSSLSLRSYGLAAPDPAPTAQRLKESLLLQLVAPQPVSPFSPDPHVQP